MIYNPRGEVGDSPSIEKTSLVGDPRRPELGGSKMPLGSCRGNGEWAGDLERAIDRVTWATGKAEDVEVIAELVAERRAMRLELGRCASTFGSVLGAVADEISAYAESISADAEQDSAVADEIPTHTPVACADRAALARRSRRIRAACAEPT
jgi:hypothetical protein